MRLEKGSMYVCFSAVFALPVRKGHHKQRRGYGRFLLLLSVSPPRNIATYKPQADGGRQYDNTEREDSFSTCAVLRKEELTGWELGKYLLHLRKCSAYSGYRLKISLHI